MPTIEVAENTFARLQKLAVPFVDNPDTVIQKLLDAAEFANPVHTNGTAQATPNRTAPREFDVKTVPNLTHTKLLTARLDGREISEITWNGLLIEAIRLAKPKGRSDEDLRRLISVNFVRGKKEDEGYHFHQDIGLSVQGQDANAAWDGAYHIARHLGVSIAVDFVWRMKDKAAYPGVAGRLSA
jgi:hypothetical protein